MTVPGTETPLRTLTHSKAFRTGGLALLLVVDVLIIVWMSSSRPGPVNFLSPLQAPFTAEQNSSTDVVVAERRAPTGTSAQESDGTVETTVSSGPSTAAAEAPERLLEFLGASAKPPFLRTGTPVRAGTSASPSRGSAVVAAAGRRAPPLVQAPGLPAGVLIPSAPATPASPLPPTLAAILPQPTTVESVAAAVTAGPTPAPDPTNGLPAVTAPVSNPRPPAGDRTSPSEAPTTASGPTSDPTPDPPAPEQPQPTPDPDPTPSDTDPAPADPPTTEPASEPTVTATATATKTPRPRCTTPPCGN